MSLEVYLLGLAMILYTVIMQDTEITNTLKYFSLFHSTTWALELSYTLHYIYLEYVVKSDGEAGRLNKR